MRVRLIRQERLHSADDRLDLAAIIDHTVLRWVVGSTAVMRAQLRHLAEIARLPTVSLRVVAPGAEPHVGMDGSFTVLSFEGTDEPDLAYVESLAGSFQIEKAEQVRACIVGFDRLCSVALDPEDSIAFIERVGHEL